MRTLRKKNKKVVILLINNIVLLVLLVFISYKAGYVNIILEKINVVQSTENIDWAAYSWEACLKKMDIDVDVCFFGDSLTCGGMFEEELQGVKSCNLGYVGDTVRNMRNRVGMINAVHPEKIFIMGGINDLNQGYSPQEVINDYEQLIDKIRSSNKNLNIYIESILPVNSGMKKLTVTNQQIDEMNNLLSEYAKENNIPYIDLHSLYCENGELPEKLSKDGVHLKEEAYEIWLDEISDILM